MSMTRFSCEVMQTDISMKFSLFPASLPQTPTCLDIMLEFSQSMGSVNIRKVGQKSL